MSGQMLTLHYRVRRAESNTTIKALYLWQTLFSLQAAVPLRVELNRWPFILVLNVRLDRGGAGAFQTLFDGLHGKGSSPFNFCRICRLRRRV